MPTISLIVPAYNAEKTILETIQSVQKQTFSDFELIVIDDGSKDRTLEQVRTVQDPRIKVFSYENGGLPVARNRGIAQSTGEFIAILDADDLWTPDKLELQLAALQQHPEAGIAYSWTLFMAERGEYFHTDEPIFFEGNVFDRLLLRNFIASGSNPLIRKTAIESVGEFDATLASCEDWDYWLRLAAKWPFAVVPKPQILYRQSLSSMSAKVEVMEKYSFLVLERAFESAPQEVQHLKNRSLAGVYHYSAELHLRNSANNISEIKQVSQKLWLAIRLHPQILLVPKIQRLLIKWIFRRIFSVKSANLLLTFIKRLRGNSMRSFQHSSMK